MLKMNRDDITPTFDKLRALPMHLAQWQRQRNAMSSFRLTVGKPAMKGPISPAQRRAQSLREIAERDRLRRETIAEVQAEIDRHMKS